MSEGDSAFARIEALKMYLEMQLGLEPFLRVYNYMQDPPEGEDSNNELCRGILGPNKTKFLPLLYQLLVCEDVYYSTDRRS